MTMTEPTIDREATIAPGTVCRDCDKAPATVTWWNVPMCLDCAIDAECRYRFYL